MSMRDAILSAVSAGELQLTSTIDVMAGGGGVGEHLDGYIASQNFIIQNLVCHKLFLIIKVKSLV